LKKLILDKVINESYYPAVKKVVIIVFLQNWFCRGRLKAQQSFKGKVPLSERKRIEGSGAKV